MVDNKLDVNGSDSILSVAQIAKRIENTSGKFAKRDLLERFSYNELFIESMKFLLNPYIKTGIKRTRLDKKIEGVEESFSDLYELMAYLEIHNTGMSEDVGRTQNYIAALETDLEKEFVTGLVTETLKIGVSAKTMNAVFGADLIPTFELQSAVHFKNIKDKENIPRFYLSLKLDGNRCAVFKENGVLTFRSRSGQYMTGFDELAPHFDHLPDNFMFDGELLIHDYDKSISSSERFQLTQKIVRKKGPKKNLEFNMFDVLAIAEFDQGFSFSTYEKRRNHLDRLEETELLKVVPILYVGEDISVIEDFMEDVAEQNLEGLMLNVADGQYKTKRTKDIIKIKDFKSGDGYVTDIYKGKVGGKHEHHLGGVYVTYKNTIVKVGGKFSDKERELFWNNPDLIVGKVIEYEYFEESKNDKGEIDLRFSTFKTIREDKTIDDLNYE